MPEPEEKAPVTGEAGESSEEFEVVAHDNEEESPLTDCNGHCGSFALD